jgi:hypothetical protein
MTGKEEKLKGNKGDKSEDAYERQWRPAPWCDE